MGGLVIFGTRIAGKAPGPRIPGDDLTVFVDASLAFEPARRFVGFPAILVLPHPLDAHGVAYRARHDQRIDDHIVGPVLAIAARRFDIDEAYLVVGKTKKFCASLA